MIDLGTGNNNKINWAMNDKQEFIDIVETVSRAIAVILLRVCSILFIWKRLTQCPTCCACVLPHACGLICMLTRVEACGPLARLAYRMPAPPTHPSTQPAPNCSACPLLPPSQVYRGARKGRGLVVSPKDYSTKYRY